jgi:hypothetical protein
MQQTVAGVPERLSVPSAVTTAGEKCSARYHSTLSRSGQDAAGTDEPKPPETGSG